MVAQLRFPESDHLYDRVTPEVTLCPKCFGVGRLILMRRYATLGAVETCPTCDGRGFVPQRNGAADLAPSAIGRRVH